MSTACEVRNDTCTDTVFCTISLKIWYAFKYKKEKFVSSRKSLLAIHTFVGACRKKETYQFTTINPFRMCKNRLDSYSSGVTSTTSGSPGGSDRMVTIMDLLDLQCKLHQVAKYVTLI